MKGALLFSLLFVAFATTPVSSQEQHLRRNQPEPSVERTLQEDSTREVTRTAVPPSTYDDSAISPERLQELRDFAAAKADPSRGYVDLPLDFQYNDEREGQAFCNFLIFTLQQPFNEVLPGELYMDCRCTFQPFRLRVLHSCRMELCERDLPSGWFPEGLPTVGEYCFTPIINGELRILSNDHTAKVCTGTTDVHFNVSALSKQTGVPLGFILGDMVTLAVPEICAVADSPPGEFSNVESCAVTIEGVDCPCTVCGPQDIKLNCTSVMDKWIPEILDPVLQYTTGCIGLSLVAPFLNFGPNAGALDANFRQGHKHVQVGGLALMEYKEV